MNNVWDKKCQLLDPRNPHLNVQRKHLFFFVIKPIASIITAITLAISLPLPLVTNEISLESLSLMFETVKARIAPISA